MLGPKADRFTHPQAGTVNGGQQGAMLQAGGCLQQQAHFFPA
jgi:hypothetical protein